MNETINQWVNQCINQLCTKLTILYPSYFAYLITYRGCNFYAVAIPSSQLNFILFWGRLEAIA